MGRGSSGAGGGGGGGSRGSFSAGGNRSGGPRPGGPGGPRPGDPGSGRHFGVIPRAPIHYHFFGRPFIITTGRSIGFIFCAIILFFSAIITACFSSNLANTVDMLDDIKEDSAECEQMILKATLYETDDCFITTGTFSTSYIYKNYYDDYTAGVFLYGDDYNGIPKYYIQFSYKVNGATYYSSTFAEYTYAQIQEFANSSDNYEQTISIVVWRDDDGYNAINLDYSEENNTNLKDTKKAVNQNITKVCISGAVLLIIIVIIILMIVMIFKKSKKADQESQNAANSEKTQGETTPHGKFCKYCGVLLDENDKKCPNCGATQFIKK